MATGAEISIEIGEKRWPEAAEPLFENFTLDVKAGTTVALVGPSGVGKSTLLRMLAGVDCEFVGWIDIDGVSAATAPPAGFVFQDARLLPWLDAAGNLRAVRPELNATDIAEALRRVGLSGYDNAYPYQLSGGMQRRLALARALAVNSRLLLLDEPFVSLDPDLAHEMQQLVRRLIVEAGVTAVFVTHVPEIAVRLADRAIVLRGRPVEIAADVTFDIPVSQRSPVDIGRFAGLVAQVD